VLKILSLRLRKVISKVIEPRKPTFLEGRRLLDNVLMANKVLEEIKRKKKSYVSSKLT